MHKAQKKIMLNMISTLLSLATEGKRMLFSGKWDLLLVLGKTGLIEKRLVFAREDEG